MRAFGTVIAGLAIALSAGCPRIAHRELSEDQVGLAALAKDNVRRVVLGPEVQSYVSTYVVFAEVVNTEVLKDLDGFVDEYNVYAHEPVTYADTGLKEVDPFLLRAAKAGATVRVGTRLMSFVGKRLQDLGQLKPDAKDSAEVYFNMTGEALSEAVRHVHDRKGTLNHEQERQIARDVIALAADMEVVDDASKQAGAMIIEGDGLRQMLASGAFTLELQSRDPSRAKLLPEIMSNVNGALAGLKAAEVDGSALVRNARLWRLTLADAMQ